MAGTLLGTSQQVLVMKETKWVATGFAGLLFTSLVPTKAAVMNMATRCQKARNRYRVLGTHQSCDNSSDKAFGRRHSMPQKILL